MTPLLTWRRASVDRSPAYAGHRKFWPSACGAYRVVWRDQCFGVALPPQYHAQFRDGTAGTWHLLSRHRKRRAAEAACERHARRSDREARKPRRAPARRLRQ